MTTDRNLLFVELTMAVILGVLITETSSMWLANFTLNNAPAILLLIALFIFIEMYIVLGRYHQQLSVGYLAVYLFFDLVIGLLFVVLVQMLRLATQPIPTGITPFSNSLLVAAGLFAVLGFRQVIMYRRITNLEAKLAELKWAKQELLIPMAADVAGILICFAIYFASLWGRFLGLRITEWSWIGLFLCFVYFFLRYGFHVKPKEPL